MPLPLVERSESEVAQIISRRVADLRGVRACREVRVRMRKKKPLVHLHLWLDDSLEYEDMHVVASQVENEVTSILPNARVTIRTEPQGSDQELVWKLVKQTAEAEPGSRGAHNIHLQKIDGKLGVDFHLEVSANMTVKEAHAVSQRIEKKLKSANTNIVEVVIHEESVSDLVSSELTGTGTELGWYVEHIAEAFPEIRALRKPVIRLLGDRYHVVLRCAFDPDISIERAHDVTRKFEAVVKAGYPNVERIDIHEEPA